MDGKIADTWKRMLDSAKMNDTTSDDGQKKKKKITVSPPIIYSLEEVPLPTRP